MAFEIVKEQRTNAMNTSIKIFILDDNRYFGTMVKHVLTKQNREITYFQTEMEFIRKLSDNPDVIILDHKLEHCTGLEILEVIKRKCGNKTNVIYFSAQEYLNVTLKSLRNGAIEYVEKGLTPLAYLDNVIEKISIHTNNFLEPINLEAYRSDSKVYNLNA